MHLNCIRYGSVGRKTKHPRDACSLGWTYWERSHLRLEARAEVRALDAGRRRDHKADDEAVKAKRLREDKDEDHADEEARLLRVGAHAGVAHDADSEARRQRRHADREPGPKVRVARVLRVRLRGVKLAVDDDGGDQA